VVRANPENKFGYPERAMWRRIPKFPLSSRVGIAHHYLKMVIGDRGADGLMHVELSPRQYHNINNIKGATSFLSW